MADRETLGRTQALASDFQQISSCNLANSSEIILICHIESNELPKAFSLKLPLLLTLPSLFPVSDTAKPEPCIVIFSHSVTCDMINLFF